MNKWIQRFFLISLLILAFFLRFYKLDSIPAGIHGDGASQGYNAFSLLTTGKDRYGQPYPILFRSLGSYQPPLYTYLTIIPITFFGNSIFAANFISAFSGVMLVLITYLFLTYSLSYFNVRESNLISLIASLMVAIAPWSILFSRLAVEANLGLLLFALSLLLFIHSLKKVQAFLVACLVLGLSTHAYYSERLIAIIFLPLFIILYRKILLQYKRWVILGLILFAITQIPHLLILNTGAFTRRFDQVSDIDNQLNLLTAGKLVINNYLIYYSPKNLFYDSDINLGRTLPGLSVFYNWLLVPLLIGIWCLLKKIPPEFSKMIGMLLVITPLAASFTGDVFYPLRVLDFLWILTIVISLGIFQLYSLFKTKIMRGLFTTMFLSYFLFSLFISYFVLFKYEKAQNYGYAYLKLMDTLSKYNDKHIMIDSARDPGIGIRIAYLKKYPPKEMQEQLQFQLKTPYYSSEVNLDEIYKIDNIEVKRLNFGDICKSSIIVGDQLAISQKQIEEHLLRLEFEIEDLSGKTALYGYSTTSTKSCPEK